MAPLNIYRSAPRHPLQVLPLLALVAMIGVSAYAVMHADWGAKSYARWVKPLVKRMQTSSGSAALDQDTEDFNAQTAMIANAQECFPLHLRDSNRVGILYLFCSDSAYVADGQARQISENFAVPASIARRFNFWRRVYSLWGKDQYVMHSSQYPEVVIESYDASRLGDSVGPIMKEIQVKRIAKSQRDLYRRLLLSMHSLRKTEERFTPAMQRLAKTMSHITDSNKYLIAAQSLRLQRGQRDFIALGLAVAPRYLPSIEQEFKAQNIPVEITRLAFVESSFNLSAYSKVGASGVYQIMPATGRQYLKMHSGVDERQDPIKASRAAAKLLRLNYNLVGSWPLAITAYNHGVGGIRRATKAVGSADIVDLINGYRGNAFGFASKNFYASFLGVLATLKDVDRLFPEVARPAALVFETVRLSKPTSIASLRKKYNLTLQEIAEYNPDISRPVIRSQGTLPHGYVMKMPSRSGTVGFTNVSLPPNS